MERPLSHEYPEYFQRYIEKVPEGDYNELLSQNSYQFLKFLLELPEQKIEYRYAEGKWNIKELLMHIIDVERVMFYRALVASREDENTIVYSMDDKLYVKNSSVENLNFEDVIEVFKHTRAATEIFFRLLSEKQSLGIANGNKGKFSARALAYIILGHCMHHENIIKERYLSEYTSV